MLFAANADPEILARDIRRQLPTQPQRAGLSAAATTLYERVLDQACRHLVQVVIQLEAFRGRALAEVLDRLSAVADQLADLFQHTPRTRLDAPRGTVHDNEFRAEYRRHLASTLDQLDLLGLGARHRNRLALSMAYLSLTVAEQHDRDSPSRLADYWFGQSDDRDRASTMRVEAAIGSARRTLVLGGAGSGKTTLVDWLAVTAARDEFTGALRDWNRCVPFLIRLRRYADSGLPRPEEFLHHTASWLVGIMPEGWVHRQLRSGRALVLVDGVDEVPADKRPAVRDWLHNLVAVNPNVRVVVTAREGAAEGQWLAAEGFTAVALRPMAPTDVRVFLDRWHAAAAGAEWLPCERGELPAVQRRLLGQLDARPDIRELAATPLLCAMLCALNLMRGTELPQNRMELYRAALAMLVELRDAERHISVLLDVNEKTVLLRDLAWRLTLADDTELSKSDALKFVTLKLRSMPSVDIKPEVVLDDLLVRTGVLREPVPDRVDFMHRTFQEYLAASEATEGEHVATLVSHAHLDTWRQTIIMACGHAKRAQARELLTRILELADHKPEYAQLLWLLAASCLETVTDIEPDLRERIDEIIRTHLVPPRGVGDVGSLAALGHQVLRYLPDNLDGLSKRAAYATVQLAVSTHHPKALPLLASYAERQDEIVQFLLEDAWQHFDLQRYADDVIAGMPLIDGTLQVRARGLLPYINGLNNFTNLSIHLRHDKLDGLDLLNGLPHLKYVDLTCNGTVDLTPLAEHQGLAHVSLSDADRYTNERVLGRLPMLATLRLFCTEGWQSISFLRDLPGLTHLELDHLDDVTDYTPLSTLRMLHTLRINDCAMLRSLKPIRHLGGLNSLRLTGCEIPDLAADIAKTFPQLTYLNIANTNVFDLTPLSTLRGLHQLYLSGDREYRGRDRLPRRVKVVSTVPFPSAVANAELARYPLTQGAGGDGHD